MSSKPHPIYITLEGGLAQAVTNVLPGIQIIIVDYDIEGADNDSLSPSPLDGKPCCLSTYTAADSQELEAR